MKTWTLKSLEPSCIIPAQTESFNFHLGLYFSQRNPAFKASSYFTIMTKSRTHHSDGNTRAHTPSSLRLPTWRWCHWMWQLSMVVCERTQSGVFFLHHTVLSSHGVLCDAGPCVGVITNCILQRWQQQNSQWWRIIPHQSWLKRPTAWPRRRERASVGCPMVCLCARDIKDGVCGHQGAWLDGWLVSQSRKKRKKEKKNMWQNNKRDLSAQLTSDITLFFCFQVCCSESLPHCVRTSPHNIAVQK